MAGQQLAGDSRLANIARMSKNQLYDIMSQMKNLIEQNHQQTRQILFQNPLLTKALFQAQIMLGMARPPQVIPSIQPPTSHNSQQSTQPTQKPSTQAAPSLPGQVGLQDQTGPSQVQAPPRKQYQNQPAMPSSSAGDPSINVQSQPMPSRPLQNPQQPKGHLNPQMNPTSPPQSSQRHLEFLICRCNHHCLHNQDHLQCLTSISSIGRHRWGPTWVTHMHAPPQHLSQSTFHSGTKPPVSTGPSFPQGQPHFQVKPPPQSMYQGGGVHLGSEFNNQAGSSMQVDRGSWMSSPPESSTVPQLPGPPPSVPSQMGARVSVSITI